MRSTQKLLIAFGAFWLSAQLVGPLGWVFGKLNDGIIYSDSMLAAVAMGVMTSMGRAVAAIIGALLAVTLIESPKPQHWVIPFAFLWVVFPHVRHHWHSPITNWDRVWYVSDLLWPASACATAALIAIHFWSKRLARDTPTPPEI